MTLLDRLWLFEPPELDPPIILYKYLAPERIDILETSKIRATQPGALNDPFEGFPSERPFGADDQILAKINSNNSIQELLFPAMLALIRDGVDIKLWTREEIRANPVDAYKLVRRAAFEQSRVNAAGKRLCDQLSPQSVFDQLVGIISLSETCDSIQMWSLYAMGHLGFVIGFNTQHEFFAKNRYGTRRVIYTEQRPTMTVGEIWRIEYHLSKGTYGRHEAEWRVFLGNSEVDPAVPTKDQLGYSVRLVDLPPGAVSCVIMGSRILPNCRARLMEILHQDPRYEHVKLYTSELDPTDYQVRILPL